ncbi:MAG: hypothetical protein R3F20_05045 [Planctomycetota bacterium]
MATMREAPTGRRGAPRGAVSPLLVVLLLVLVGAALVVLALRGRGEPSPRVGGSLPDHVAKEGRDDGPLTPNASARGETRLVLDRSWDLGMTLAEVERVLGVVVEVSDDLAGPAAEAFRFFAWTVAEELTLYPGEFLRGIELRSVAARRPVGAPDGAVSPEEAAGRIELDPGAARGCGDCLAAGLHRAIHRHWEAREGRGEDDPEWAALDPRFPPGEVALIPGVDHLVSHALVANLPGFASLEATRSGANDRAELFAAMVVAWDEVVLRGVTDPVIAVKAAELRRRLRAGDVPIGAPFWVLCARRAATPEAGPEHRWPRGPHRPVAGRTALEWWIELRGLGRATSEAGHPPFALDGLRRRLAALVSMLMRRANGGVIDDDNVRNKIEWMRADLASLRASLAAEDIRRIEDAVGLVESGLEEE